MNKTQKIDKLKNLIESLNLTDKKRLSYIILATELGESKTINTINGDSDMLIALLLHTFHHYPKFKTLAEYSLKILPQIESQINHNKSLN